MIPNILQLLTTAIKEKRCVAIRYYDQRHIRVIEPHVIYTSENGEMVMDGFQTRGYSSSGRPPPFWRPFRLKKISAISLLKEQFRTRVEEGFSPEKIKYRNGTIAVVDSVRKPFIYPAHAVPRAVPQEASSATQMGPFLPKNPHRR